jgi:hypothetical protein
MIEARGVMATFIPALVEIVGKLVHLRWLTVRRLPFRKLSAPQPTPNRFPALSRNSTGGLFYGLFAGFTAFNLDVDD